MPKVEGRKTIFDHISAITENQSKKYWDELTDLDKSNFSIFIINRFLSMKSDWVGFINYAQQFPLKSKEVYRLYSNVLPKGKVWLKYIKAKNVKKYPDWVVDHICSYFECSKKEANEYINLFYLSEKNRAELKEILEKYGSEPKEIKKLKL